MSHFRTELLRGGPVCFARPHLGVAENVLFQKHLASKVICGRQPGGNRVATYFYNNLPISWYTKRDPESRPRAAMPPVTGSASAGRATGDAAVVKGLAASSKG